MFKKVKNGSAGPNSGEWCVLRKGAWLTSPQTTECAEPAWAEPPDCYCMHGY